MQKAVTGSGKPGGSGERGLGHPQTLACGDAGEERGRTQGWREVTPVLPSQPSRPVWSSTLHFGGLGSRWVGTSGSSGWVSVGSWRVGTEINRWRLCEDRPVPGFTAAFRENPGLDGPSCGKMEAAEGVFWLALQSARHLTTARAHRAILQTGI